MGIELWLGLAVPHLTYRSFLGAAGPLAGTREPSERTHVCTVCYKAFIRREHLQRHMKIHGT